MAVRVVRLLWNEMPFFHEFVHFDGIEKILNILVKNTKTEAKIEPTKSIVEQSTYEKERVEFMQTHIQCMERINSKAFDREILKTTKPPDEDTFKIPDAQDRKELVGELLRCLETLTANNSTYRALYHVSSIIHGRSIYIS